MIEQEPDKESKKESEAMRLASMLQDSTSSEKDKLNIYEIKENEDLHFSVKKNSLLTRMGSKMGGRNGGEKEVKLKADFKILDKGVWAEIETKEQTFWSFIKTVADDDGQRLTVSIYPSKNSESELLGQAIIGQHDNGFIAYFSKMAMEFHADSTSWLIKASAVEQVVMKKAQGLVLSGGSDTLCIFDDKSAKVAAVEQPGASLCDCRKTIMQNVSFYRGGSIPFACFDLEEFRYCYVNDDKDESK